MHRAREPNSTALIALGTKGIPKQTEIALSSRDRQNHGAKLPQKLLSLVEGGTELFGSNGIEGFKQSSHPVMRELHGHGTCVE
jgi:hypothetical protein